MTHTPSHQPCVLVTGASGFIGRALCRRIQEGGRFNIRAATRGEQTLGSIRCDAVGSIDERTDWSPVLSGVDVVVHLAARVHVMRDPEPDPLAAFRRANLTATLNLARQAGIAGVRRFVFFSSAKVLGERGVFDDNTIPAPQEPYGISKLEAEEGLAAVAQSGQMDVVTIRPPLVYGPGVRGNFLALMRSVAKGFPLPLGSVRNRRSLVGLGNLVDFAVQCLDDPRVANRRFLVRDREDLSTPELIRRVGSHLGTKPNLIPCPVWLLRTLGDLSGRSAAIARLTEDLVVEATGAHDLGWLPPRTLDDELDDLVPWFRQSGTPPPS